MPWHLSGLRDRGEASLTPFQQTVSTEAAPFRSLYGRVERLALVAGALIMLGIVAASVVIAARTDVDMADAEHAQTARSITVDLLQAVTSAETGQRGYLLTGRTGYRDAYDEATRLVPGLLQDLDRALPGDPDLPAWRSTIQAKMAELAETVRLEESGRHDDALAMVLTDSGKRAMDTARAIATRLAARERRAIISDLQRSQSGTRLLVLVDSGAFLVLVLLVYFVSNSLTASIRRLQHSEEALRAANLELAAGRDRLELAVAERTAELTNANDEIQRFAYIVSHDLRAPLLNIIGFTGELEDATNRLNRFVGENLESAGIAVPGDVRQASQEDLPEAIRFIQTSTAKMDRLITAILRLSREGRRVLTPERLDMAALLGGILDSVRHQADAAGAELSLGAMPQIVADRLAVEQVFSNLVENALKYPAAGRPVRIRVDGQREGRFARFEVRDNGRGIAERDRERIFELFRRAGVQDTAGEGIGLAHVRALLRRMGGTIACDSAIDVGSTFIVRLPITMSHSGEKPG
jgi:signal transduction histidine kinase